MSAPRKAGEAATLNVDYDCERRCQAEVDLQDTQIRFTLGQMLALAAGAHREAHKGEQVRVYRFGDDVLVRSAVADA